MVQGDTLRLDPENVCSFTYIEAQNLRARNAALDRVKSTDRTPAERGLQRCTHGVATRLRYQFQFLHGSLLVRMPKDHALLRSWIRRELSGREPTTELNLGRNLHGPTASQRSLTLCHALPIGQG